LKLKIAAAFINMALIAMLSRDRVTLRQKSEYACWQSRAELKFHGKISRHAMDESTISRLAMLTLPARRPPVHTGRAAGPV